MSTNAMDAAPSQKEANDNNKVAVDVNTLVVAARAATFTGTVPNVEPVNDALRFTQYVLLLSMSNVVYQGLAAPTRRQVVNLFLSGLSTKALRTMKAVHEHLKASKTPKQLAKTWLVERVKVTRELALLGLPRDYVDRLPVNWDPETAAAHSAVLDCVVSVLNNRDPGVLTDEN